MSDHWIERLFSSTRGQIVLLLRRCEQTVSDLADALDLTDNAIRSQLTKLERDQLVTPTGKRPGTRKPETVYGLTEQAETLFPKAYDLLLDHLLQVITDRDGNAEDLLREVGRRLANQYAGRVSAGESDGRVDGAVEVLEEMGGLPTVEEKAEDHLVVRGKQCPFGAVVPHHPAVCAMTESFLAHLTKRPVRQECDQDADPPQCCFVIEVETQN